MARCLFPTTRESEIAVLNFRGPYSRIDHRLAIVLGAILDGERPEVRDGPVAYGKILQIGRSWSGDNFALAIPMATLSLSR